MTGRGATFLTVGAAGFAIQIATLAFVTSVVGWPYVPATALAVEAAVLNNFWWHERWTWRDRALSCAGSPSRLGRYHLVALTSIGGNLVLTALFVEVFHLPVIAANVTAVAAMAAGNFLIGDRWVFVPRRAAPLVLIVAFAGRADGEPLAKPETIAAWDRFVAQAETRLHACWCAPGAPEGKTHDVPGGTIHQWRGSVFVRGVRVESVVDALMHPGTPPPQDDVLESRVLARMDDTLKVYLKLTRRAIVSVTYDTVHEVTFERRAPGLATSRSIATRIVEADGGDRGFLWRLNSYWRYTQHRDGVRIDLESLSLSRQVPFVVKPAAGPLINRVGRESVNRTLEALQSFIESRQR